MAGAAGATALRGVWGYHGDHEPHGDRSWSLRRHVPVLTVIVDTPERIREWFAIIDELTDEAGLVTSEMVPGVPGDRPGRQQGRLHPRPAPLTRIERRASDGGITASNAPAADTADRAAEGLCPPRAARSPRWQRAPRPRGHRYSGEPGDERCDLDLTGGRQGDRALRQATGDEQAGSPQRRAAGRCRAVVEGHASRAGERDQRNPDGGRAA